MSKEKEQTEKEVNEKLTSNPTDLDNSQSEGSVSANDSVTKDGEFDIVNGRRVRRTDQVKVDQKTNPRTEVEEFKPVLVEIQGKHQIQVDAFGRLVPATKDNLQLYDLKVPDKAETTKKEKEVAPKMDQDPTPDSSQKTKSKSPRKVKRQEVFRKKTGYTTPVLRKRPDEPTDEFVARAQKSGYIGINNTNVHFAKDEMHPGSSDTECIRCSNARASLKKGGKTDSGSGHIEYVEIDTIEKALAHIEKTPVRHVPTALLSYEVVTQNKDQLHVTLGYSLADAQTCALMLAVREYLVRNNREKLVIKVLDDEPFTVPWSDTAKVRSVDVTGSKTILSSIATRLQRREWVPHMTFYEEEPTTGEVHVTLKFSMAYKNIMRLAQDLKPQQLSGFGEFMVSDDFTGYDVLKGKDSEEKEPSSEEQED
jgi:hypothetical protein